MDSGNSGSMQSSSGGDEEYDSSSRANPSSFLLPAPFSSALHHHHHHHQQPSSSAAATAPAAAYFDNPIATSNTYLNFINSTMIPHLPNLPSVPSSSHHHHLQPDPDATILNQSRSFPPDAMAAASSGHTGAGVGVVTKNPKKRTRASRRAPTTVLTTDTSNFRAMVQEFTGIPAPPFSTGGHPYSSSRRLDIFRSSHPLDSLYNNPFRGTAQKVQALIPSSSSSSSSSCSSSLLNHHITVDATNVATSMASPAINAMSYHVLPDLPFPKMPLNSQNPTFHQSLLSLDHELNATNLGAVHQDHHHHPHHQVGVNGGDVNQDDQDHDHHHHQLMIRQFDVPPPSTSLEFDRREKESEIHSNVPSSSSDPRTMIKGTATTATTLHPWICPTDH